MARRRVWRPSGRTAIGWGVVSLALVVVVAAVLARDHPSSTTKQPATTDAPSAATQGPVPVTAVQVQSLGSLLPRGLSGLSAAPLNGQIYLFGGYGNGQWSRVIYDFNPASEQLQAVGNLPVALHDAGAAAGADSVVLCGGGQTVGSKAILAFTPGQAVMAEGSLPVPLSDDEGVTVGTLPYCLGGWTGQVYSDAVYSVGSLQGGVPTVAAQLPDAVRYAAAVEQNGGILVAGGLVASGSPTDVLQWVPLPQGVGQMPQVVGQLPSPLAWAMGAVLGSSALVMGGCGTSGTPVSGIEAVRPSGTVHTVGQLPVALCDGAAASSAGAIYVFGGEGAGNQPERTVWKITQIIGTS